MHTHHPRNPQLEAEMDTQKSKFKVIAASVGLALGLSALVWVGLNQLSGNPHLDEEEGHSSHSGEALELGIGSPLPNLELQSLDKKLTRLSQVAGKVTLINFWATWCESCLVEMPSIEKLYSQFKDQGLQVIAVSLDETSTSEEIAPLVKKLNLSFPVFEDPQQRLSELLSISAIPITLVVDADLKILMVENGERDWFSSEIQDLTKKWLAQSTQE